MKKIILPALLLLCFATQAQQKARLDKVTVYPRGAVLEHSARIALKKGTQTIVLRGLASEVDAASMLIELDGYVNVLSHKYMRTWSPDQKKPDAATEARIARLEKKAALFSKEIKTLQQQIGFENKSMEMILSSPKSGVETAMNVDALSGYVTLYKDHAYKSQAKINQLTDRQEILNDSIHNINEKIQALQENQQNKAELDSLKSLGCLELQLYAPQDLISNLQFSYYSQQASWKASYDVLGEDIGKPLKIKYKANINQLTGIDWKNIKVSVSTSQPNRSNAQPMLTAWYLDVYKGYQRSAEGLYNSVGATNTIPSFGTINTLKEINMMEQTGINISFDSELAYTIPSDNSLNIISLKTIEVACHYKYYTVPKLDRDVFLLAEIQDFEQFNFLPGEAQVFLEGKFTGKTLLDPFVTTETINLSLGRDQNVVVKREKAKVKEKTRFIDGDKTDVFKYNILVKNNKMRDITIIIKDQYPMTTNEKIKISNQEHSKGGTLNESNGVVTWIETLKKTESKEVSVGYSVTRPKEMVIPGL